MNREKGDINSGFWGNRTDAVQCINAKIKMQMRQGKMLDTMLDSNYVKMRKGWKPVQRQKMDQKN